MSNYIFDFIQKHFDFDTVKFISINKFEIFWCELTDSFINFVELTYKTLKYLINNKEREIKETKKCSDI